MTPGKQNKLAVISSVTAISIAVGSIVFSGYGFYYRTESTTNIAVPALQKQLQDHINVEALRDDKTVDKLTEISTAMGKAQQAIQDLKEELNKNNNQNGENK